MKRVILLLIALAAIIGLILWTKQDKSFEEKLKEAPTEENWVPTPVATIAIPTHAKEEGATLAPTPDVTPEPIGKFTLKNIQKEKWYEGLKESLLAFQDPTTKVFMEGLESPKKEANRQIVLVTYIQRTGNRSTFKALINTQNGRIIRTWDQTQFEPFGKKEVRIKPSGVLK